jgi:hypothetical protein
MWVTKGVDGGSAPEEPTAAFGHLWHCQARPCPSRGHSRSFLFFFFYFLESNAGAPTPPWDLTGVAGGNAATSRPGSNDFSLSSPSVGLMYEKTLAAWALENATSSAFRVLENTV